MFSNIIACAFRNNSLAKEKILWVATEEQTKEVNLNATEEQKDRRNEFDCLACTHSRVCVGVPSLNVAKYGRH